MADRCLDSVDDSKYARVGFVRFRHSELVEFNERLKATRSCYTHRSILMQKGQRAG
jgi:hypothetical protein